MERTEFDHVWTNARVATFVPWERAAYGMLEGHALAVRGEHIAAILPTDAPEVRAHSGPVTDCTGCIITPGLIDCHTHLVWGGSRAAEYALRLASVPYTEIAKQGGGILSTMPPRRAR